MNTSVTLVENALGIIYNICFIGCFWPQIYKSIKTKSVEDVSIMLCFMSIIGYAAALGYALLKFGFDYWLCINYILSGMSVIAMVGVYYKYKK
ncbi:MAG: PQ-loop repeat-containing protein [Acholeplasmataceae bacterium]